MKHIFLLKQNMRGNVNLLVEQINEICGNFGYDYVIAIAGNSQDIEEYASECTKDDYIVYAIGDDEDVNLVLNGIIKGNAKLGIIPIGNYNNFYRSLEEYKSDFVNVNLMQVNDRFGINNFNLGMNADIFHNMAKLKKFGFPENVLYNLSLLYTTFKAKGFVIGINNFFTKELLFNVSNGPYIAGGYPIAPMATIHREEVSVVTLSSDIPRREIPKFWLEMINKKHLSNQYASFYYSEQKLIVETQYEQVGQLDGMLVQGSEFVINPKARKIEVVNNRKLIRELQKK